MTPRPYAQTINTGSHRIGRGTLSPLTLGFFVSGSPSSLPPAPGSPGGGFYGMDPYAALLAPARRAGVLMYVLGGLMLLGGLCFVGTGVALPWARFFKENHEQLKNLPPELTPQMLKLAIIVAGAISGALGIVFLILANFVRKGSTAASITGIVLSSLVSIYLAISLLATAGRGTAGGAGGLVIFVIPLALFIWQIAWLVPAARTGTELRTAQAQYQAQYWQHQQQQQTFGSGGYGAQAQGTPPQPPMPPPPPPPDEPPSNPSG